MLKLLPIHLLQIDLLVCGGSNIIGLITEIPNGILAHIPMPIPMSEVCPAYPVPSTVMPKSH